VRIEFERVMRETPPELLGLTSDEEESMLSDIDPPCLAWPRVERRRIGGRMMFVPALAE
jgi:hypothetical protein